MNTSHKKLIYLGLGLVFVLIATVIFLDPLKKPSTDRAFTDSVSQVSFTYPVTATLITNPEEMKGIGYFPTCNSDNAIACVYFASSTYPGSNFNSAGVTIRIARELATEDVCYTQTNQEQNTIEEVMIDGLPFASFGTGDAGMSKQSGGINYRTFQNDMCYEVTTRVNTTTYEVSDPTEVSEFTESQKLELVTQLVTTVRSVRIPR